MIDKELIMQVICDDCGQDYSISEGCPCEGKVEEHG